MRTYVIISLILSNLSFIAAIVLLLKKPRTDKKDMWTAVLGGFALFCLIFCLCLGYFMV